MRGWQRARIRAQVRVQVRGQCEYNRKDHRKDDFECRSPALYRLRVHARSTALVAMTGWGMAADRQRCEAAGFAAHILKPAGIEDIEAELARLLRTDSASPATGAMARARLSGPSA